MTEWIMNADLGVFLAGVAYGLLLCGMAALGFYEGKNSRIDML